MLIGGRTLISFDGAGLVIKLFLFVEVLLMSALYIQK